MPCTWDCGPWAGLLAKVAEVGWGRLPAPWWGLLPWQLEHVWKNGGLPPKASSWKVFKDLVKMQGYLKVSSVCGLKSFRVLWKPVSFPLFQCVRESTLGQTSPSSVPAHQVTGRKAAEVCALDCTPVVPGTVRSTAFHGCAVSWPLSLLESTGHMQVIGRLKRAEEKAAQFCELQVLQQATWGGDKINRSDTKWETSHSCNSLEPVSLLSGRQEKPYLEPEHLASWYLICSLVTKQTK